MFIHEAFKLKTHAETLSDKLHIENLAKNLDHENYLERMRERHIGSVKVNKQEKQK